MVAKLDRLARSVRPLTEVAAELEAVGCDLVVLDLGLDSSTPTGKLLFHVMGAFAELERSLIQERTRAAVETARRKGKHIGRPNALDANKIKRAVRKS